MSQASPLEQIVFSEDFEDKFEIGKKLGNGAFGAVYSAKSKANSKVVAVKFMNADDDEKDLLIRNEIVLMKMLNSENVVQFFAAFKVDKDYKLVIEFIDGIDVKKLQDKMDKKIVPLNITSYIMSECLKGLAHMHSKKIVHLDIKQANIMLNMDGSVKLVDLGFSQLGPFKEKKQWSVAGTRGYKAPELYVQKCGPSCDIWSLGATFVYMLRRNGLNFFIDTPNIDKKYKTGDVNIVRFPGTCDSEEALNFYQQTMVVDMDERPGAEALLRHPLLWDEENLSELVLEGKKAIVDAISAATEESFQFPNVRKHALAEVFALKEI